VNAELMALWRRYEPEGVAADAIYATLREAILRGLLPGGERLAEVELGALFKRSRTPVREAILRLESEQLAERSARRGYVVCRITREQILELYAVRETLYGLAARLAAEGILANELQHLSWLNAQCRKAAEQQDYARMVELTVQFHDGIGQASRNALLLHFMRQIHDRVRRLRSTTFSYPGRAIESVDEHDTLLDALRRRDPDAAEQIARAHIARAREIRVAMLQSSGAHRLMNPDGAGPIDEPGVVANPVPEVGGA
jgi:DNA-binding GntR family transcriptional regulator